MGEVEMNKDKIAVLSASMERSANAVELCRRVFAMKCESYKKRNKSDRKRDRKNRWS